MKTDKDLSRLQDLSQRILDESENLRRNSTKTGDHFPFLAMHYLYKQIEHMKAIMILGTHRDAILVLRAMLEGWAQLRWVQQKPERAEIWRAYAGVHDFYLARKQKERGASVPDNAGDWLKLWLQDHSAEFLTNKAASKLAKSPNLSVWDITTPFRKSWCKHDLRHLMEEIGHEYFYDQYKRMSGWQHWSCCSFGSAVIVDGENRQYDPCLSMDDQVWHLVLGSLCLVQTSIINSHHTEREQEKIGLAALQDEWLCLQPEVVTHMKGNS
jgi:hypothetical protein